LNHQVTYGVQPAWGSTGLGFNLPGVVSSKHILLPLQLGLTWLSFRPIVFLCKAKN